MARTYTRRNRDEATAAPESTDAPEVTQNDERTLTVTTDTEGLITGETVNEGTENTEGTQEGTQEGAQEGTQEGTQEGNGAAAATPVTIDASFIATGAFDLSAATDMQEVLTTQGAPKRDRNERQKAMDTEVEKIHAHWTEVGRPSTWGKLVETKSTLTYFLEPEKAAPFKKLVTKAATYLSAQAVAAGNPGIRIRWGSSFVATEAMQQRFNLPAEYIGREVISFAVMDKRPRNTNGSAVTTTTVDAATDDDDDDDDDDDE